MIDKPLPKKAQRRFAKLAAKYDNGIYYLLIDNSFLEKFPIKGMSYWSIATYYRLYASELLPATVHRILYLDCDIIVNGKLDYLWQVDMTDMAAGCIPDIFNYSSDYQRRLQYPVEATYFNAGVMLINVDYWREHAIGQLCLDFLANHYDLIEANDQDVLNAVLWDRKLELPLTYNYQLQFLSNYFFNLQFPSMKQNILDTYENPTIIHYAYSIKPWSVMYYRLPFSDVWEHYKRISQWSHTLPTLPRRKVVNNLIKRYIMWPMGLMKYNSGFVV